MSIYDSEKKMHVITIRLTDYQYQRLKHIIDLFRISIQRLVSDLLDSFAVDTIRVTSGTQTINGAVHDSSQGLFDNMVDLRGLKGEIKAPYTKEHKR